MHASVYFLTNWSIIGLLVVFNLSGGRVAAVLGVLRGFK